MTRGQCYTIVTSACEDIVASGRIGGPGVAAGLLQFLDHCDDEHGYDVVAGYARRAVSKFSGLGG